MSALYQIGDFVGIVEPAPRAAPIPKLWFMLRIVPNREMTVTAKLLDRGVSVYLPKEKRTVRTVWNRRSLREVPIFAGALFIPDFEANLRRLKELADGIIGYVCFGDEAARIRPAMMDRIRNFERALDLPPSQRKRAFAVGQPVRIAGGPFDMWEGRVERLDSHHRLRVLLNILEREVPVEFDEDQIEAV